MYGQLSLNHLDTEENLKHDFSKASSARARNVSFEDF